MRGYPQPTGQFSDAYYYSRTGGREGDSNYLVDNSPLLGEFELEYPPFPTTVLEIINNVRRDAGLPLVS